MASPEIYREMPCDLHDEMLYYLNKSQLWRDSIEKNILYNFILYTAPFYDRTGSSCHRHRFRR